MLILLPIVVPFIFGILTLLLLGFLRLQRIASVVGAVIYAVVAVLVLQQVSAEGILVTQIGGWQAPFGISIVADRLSAMMICLVAIIGNMTILYSTVNIDRQRTAFGYYPLINFLMMGVSGAFLTGDMFNLYVWFEVLLISSFVLLGLGARRLQLQGTFKYVIINLVASTTLLTALGLLYGLTGTLNMAQLALVVPERAAENPTLILTLSTLFMVAFGIKAAMFPFFFWMPASYHTPPVSVSAFFAGLLTKVGVYSLVRVFTLIFTMDMAYTHGTLLIALAAITMVTGVFGAMSQMEMRQILAFHSVSQVGYMIMGLALSYLSPLALAGTLLYIIHHSVVKSNLFFIAGTVRWLRGTAELRRLGGLIKTRPYLSVLFFITAMSLAGIPPLSGFWAKFTLIRAGFETQAWLVTAAALFTGVWTLYSMTKIWSYAFWRSPQQAVTTPIDYTPAEVAGHYAPIAVLMVATILVGVVAEPFLSYTQAAAEQLLNSAEYITAVLGEP